MRLFLPICFFILSLIAMSLLLVLEPEIPPAWGFMLAAAGIIAIIAFSWAGLFVDSLPAYLYFSTIIQSAYFILDVGSAGLAAKSTWFAFLQVLNFSIAGGLFMIVLTLAYHRIRQEPLSAYSGLYEKNKLLVSLLALSCLSLGGMAGFNIFVGEFLLYSFLFSIHPALAALAIFAGLVCFLFYFRICYGLLVRKSGITIGVPLPLKIVACALGVLVAGLGIVPHILLYILEVIA